MKAKQFRLFAFWVLFVAAIAMIANGVFSRPNLLSGGPSKKTTCINQLQLIENAKILWAEESKAASNAAPTLEELRKFLTRKPTDQFLKCPEGGVYTVGTITNRPICSISSHALKE